MARRERLDTKRLLLISQKDMGRSLGEALAPEYALEQVREFADAFAKVRGHAYAGLLVDQDLAASEPPSTRARIARLHWEAPVILLTRGDAPASGDLVREFHAYHALPYTGRGWGYVARSIVDVLDQRDLEKDNALLRSVFEHASDCIVIIDAQGRIRQVNGAVVRTFGYARSELRGAPLAAVFPRSSIGKKGEGIFSALEDGAPWSGEAQARRRDGETLPVHAALSFVHDYDGETTAGIIIARDVTDLQRLLGRLTELSIMDELTQVYNVRYFWARFRYELLRSRRYKQLLSLLMLDLDHFKAVNDTYGHQVGDSVLHHVAAVMRSTTREVDIVARYGGEEFALILPSTGVEGALECARHLRATIEETPLILDDQVLRVTVSIGVAGLTRESLDEDQFLKRADDALRMAKRRGRNRVCVWEPDTAARLGSA
jgi:diguanylate cyclase (GGDEF)-like protein/PAS domain S-box-containing protein